MDPALFEIVIGDGPIVATAIHDGHDLRPDCAEAMVLDEATRLREEDPFTARFAAIAPTRLVAKRSRFEVDLNRPRDKAVYTCAEDAWGLDVWRATPSAELVADSLAIYDAYYAALERVLRDKIAKHGKVVVLDCHSYNHRRDRVVADPAANPEINLGTGTVPAQRRPLVDRFRSDLAAQGFDVRENVKFKGGEMSRWVHATFPTTAVCLALELKKTFMDEWTGVPDDAAIARITRGLETTLPGLAEPP
jgi:N-formylglutamate deformylase